MSADGASAGAAGVREGGSVDLSVAVAGLAFQNPIVLASGTAAYGRELAEVLDLEALGGFVTKAVSPLPRSGAPAPRVSEGAPGVMLNAVGLANPGLEEVRRSELPWIAEHVQRARVLVNVVGDTVDDYAAVVAGLDGSRGVDGFELNVSCPNVKAGGIEFGADRSTLFELVRSARGATKRPLFVKLGPTLPDIAGSACTAADAGADAITLVNTMPGLVVDVERRRPVLGFGTGGASGAALLPIGVLAVWKVRQAVQVPIMGVGGVFTERDALQYLIAGASLIGVGTAALRDPRAPQRIVRRLERWCRRNRVGALADIVGTLQWPH